jgi:hypothetical protein
MTVISVVTNAMEALWQEVDEEAADELACGERHDFVARSGAQLRRKDAPRLYPAGQDFHC